MPDFQLVPISVIEATNPETWREVGRDLGRSRNRLEVSGSRQMWAVGDWIVLGEDVVFASENKRRLRQMASSLTGYSNHTLSMAASVSRRVRPYMRIDGLSWWHHEVVAKLSEQEQSAWLTRAAEHEWSVRELRIRLREGKLANATFRRMKQERLVRELTKLSLSDIDHELVARIRQWLQIDSTSIQSNVNQTDARHTERLQR